MKLREERKDTFLEARLNFDGIWQDALIRNVSNRGVMVQCKLPPPRGAYVEIRRGGYAIVGHVRWQGNHCFGTRAQDAIDLAGLNDQSIRRVPAGGERRSAPRHGPARRVASMRTARQTGGLIELAAFTASLVLVAAYAAVSAHAVLSDPLGKAEEALALHVAD